MPIFSSGRNWPEQLDEPAAPKKSFEAHSLVAASSHAPASIAGNAQHADNSSPRRLRRRPELRRGRAPGNIHILLARFEEPARWAGARQVGIVVVAARGSSAAVLLLI